MATFVSPQPKLPALLALFGGAFGLAIGTPGGFLLPFSFLGLVCGFAVCISAVMLYRRPKERLAWGVAITWFAAIGVAVSVLWLLVAIPTEWQLGLFIGILGLLGMSLATAGGIMSLFWKFRGSVPASG